MHKSIKRYQILKWLFQNLIKCLVDGKMKELRFQTFVLNRSPRKGALLKETRALTLRGKPWLSSEGLR